LRIPSNLMKTSAVPTFNADENLKVTDWKREREREKKE
jgi:hypothetical protein